MTAQYHTSCSTLMLKQFIKIRVEGDLNALIISGTPSVDELVEAWKNITDEFYDLAEKAYDTYVLETYMEMESLYYKIQVIGECLSLMKTYRCDELVRLLKDMGYDYPFNADDEIQYIKDLERVNKRSKALVLEYNDKVALLDILKKKESSEQEESYKYYDKILVTLSKFNGYKIEEENTTVSRYAALLNLYITYCEITDKSLADGGRE